MWHFNNAARTQSLKGLEIAMNYSNVMDIAARLSALGPLS